MWYIQFYIYYVNVCMILYRNKKIILKCILYKISLHLFNIFYLRQKETPKFYSTKIEIHTIYITK